jgi:hypothetical protein
MQSLFPADVLKKETCQTTGYHHLENNSMNLDGGENLISFLFKSIRGFVNFL